MVPVATQVAMAGVIPVPEVKVVARVVPVVVAQVPVASNLYDTLSEKGVMFYDVTP